jgi:Collagen triple helix repeat (20 copies)
VKFTKKSILISIATLVFAAIALPAGLVLAAPHVVPTTIFACESTDGSIVLKADATSCGAGTTEVQWNVTGPQGVQGLQGSSGTNGKDGTPGATGATGLKGDTGATGVAGPAGAVGLTGTKGDKGDPGAVGPTGLAGAQGAPGLSKYAVVSAPEIAANPGQIESANCPAGDVVLGGGAAVDGTSSNFALSVSRPSNPHHAWQAAYSSNNGKHTRLSVWATCAVVAG